MLVMSASVFSAVVTVYRRARWCSSPAMISVVVIYSIMSRSSIGTYHRAFWIHNSFGVVKGSSQTLVTRSLRARPVVSAVLFLTPKTEVAHYDIQVVAL